MWNRWLGWQERIANKDWCRNWSGGRCKTYYFKIYTQYSFACIYRMLFILILSYKTDWLLLNVQRVVFQLYSGWNQFENIYKLYRNEGGIGQSWRFLVATGKLWRVFRDEIFFVAATMHLIFFFKISKRSVYCGLALSFLI